MQSQIQGFQLSPQQQRLWLLQENNHTYYSQCAILIEGNLDVELLRSILQKVVDRHEILRTNFYRDWGIKVPLQVIKDENISINIQNLGDNYCEADISQLLQQARLNQLHWEKDSLLYLSLINFSVNKLLLISLPALCADLTTLHNLVREVACCYTGEAITDEPLQYADIAAWQNELLTEAKTTSWQQPDISSLKNLQLVSEKLCTENSEFEPQYINSPINNNLLEKIKLIADKYQASLNGLLLTCWQILLWRLTGKSNLLLGIGVNGRNYEELKPALGLLTKYLPLVCVLKPDIQFNDLMSQTEQMTNEISEWQESFIWDIEHELQFSFFPFCYEFADLPTKYSAGNVSFSICQRYVCSDRFKVKLSCFTQDNTLNAEFHYDASLFTPEAIQCLAEQFQTLLTSVIQNPEATITRLDVLSMREREQLLFKFNDTQTPLPKYECVHHWFEEQCATTPDRIAVIFGEQQLTYHQLNTCANQLAHHLHSLGIAPDTLIGLYVERSPLMLIGLLGILKAGAAYIPIDPSYPPERQAYILRDTQTSLVLTQQSLTANILADNLKVVCLDRDWDLIATQPTENAVTSTTALNLAYVIYTSGSTGEPKGTLIPHRGLVNYLSWATQAYAVAEGTGTLVHSSLGFDLTITSLFTPLLVGNQVELLPDQSIESLATTLKERNNLSLVKLTPSHLKLLSQQLSPHQVAERTRTFVIGGENLTSENIAFWQDFAPETILVNEYGPTETVVGCCIYQVPTNLHQSGSIPIGQAIANTQLYVLDEYLQPVPLGVIGELYIGGAGLARGYYNRPELTAEKFVPHPYSNEPGARLYKTGDLVKFRPDGLLEFLGRIDEQVKIRGFRIELGEIESALLQYPAIKDCVVTVRQEADDQRLVAYIVLKQSSFSIGNLKKFLQQQLPEYMIPSVFITLKELPLTANGKVNRQELPVPDQVRPELDEFYVAPRNSTEEKIAKIWAQILKLERIGIHDNFFDLGGHSLLITQVISRLRDVFDVEIFVQQMFETPTIADLALIVTQKLAEQTDTEILAQAFAELELLEEHNQEV